MSGRTGDTCESKGAGNLNGGTEGGRPAIGIGTETGTPGIPEDGSADSGTRMITAAITLMGMDMARIQSITMMGTATKMADAATVTIAITIGDEEELQEPVEPRRYGLSSVALAPGTMQRC
jgi:hypothetical protein